MHAGGAPAAAAAAVAAGNLAPRPVFILQRRATGRAPLQGPLGPLPRREVKAHRPWKGHRPILACGDSNRLLFPAPKDQGHVHCPNGRLLSLTNRWRNWACVPDSPYRTAALACSKLGVSLF
ncbi:hypothetical protein CSIM01_13007 [Colletotrichum simmondsii]|uniref:Uncharacterized protein n=1 Tax=Colletotrichum simmondsii TaxID=703756 RepID=A0A135TFL6_9PEZI|nr:hypothetical protein CSIM01_13007 [Colletotrichum simmondsii]